LFQKRAVRTKFDVYVFITGCWIAKDYDDTAQIKNNIYSSKKFAQQDQNALLK